MSKFELKLPKGLTVTRIPTSNMSKPFIVENEEVSGEFEIEDLIEEDVHPPDDNIFQDEEVDHVSKRSRDNLDFSDDEATLPRKTLRVETQSDGANECLYERVQKIESEVADLQNRTKRIEKTVNESYLLLSAINVQIEHLRRGQFDTKIAIQRTNKAEYTETAAKSPDYLTLLFYKNGLTRPSQLVNICEKLDNDKEYKRQAKMAISAVGKKQTFKNLMGRLFHDEFFREVSACKHQRQAHKTYWLKDDDFDSFFELIKDTWDGYDANTFESDLAVYATDAHNRNKNKDSLKKKAAILAGRAG